jgi:hypothetical protein
MVASGDAFAEAIGVLKVAAARVVVGTGQRMDVNSTVSAPLAMTTSVAH